MQVSSGSFFSFLSCNMFSITAFEWLELVYTRQEQVHQHKSERYGITMNMFNATILCRSAFIIIHNCLSRCYQDNTSSLVAIMHRHICIFSSFQCILTRTKGDQFADTFQNSILLTISLSQCDSLSVFFCVVIYMNFSQFSFEDRKKDRPRNAYICVRFKNYYNTFTYTNEAHMHLNATAQNMEHLNVKIL